jgi:hypothetical protein
VIERNAVELAFVSAPGAARRVLNQVSTTDQQFYIIRTLHVLNEKIRARRGRVPERRPLPHRRQARPEQSPARTPR